MKKILYFILFSVFATYGWAQQFPHFTQFMYNMNTVNPAYAGIKNGLSGGILYRTQWAGGDQNPVSLTFNLHSRIGQRSGVGLSAIRDRYGLAGQTDVALDFSHAVKITDAINLALGLKVGMGFDGLNMDDVVVVHPDDGLIQNYTAGKLLTYGVGALLYSDKFYVSVSVPNFNTHPYTFNDQVQAGRVIHYFGAAGYVFDAGENLKIKPHVMVYQAVNTPITTMLNTNFFIHNLLELGVSYRVNDAVSALINYNLTEYIKIGYAYDRTLSPMKIYSPHTHELFMNFQIPYTGKKALMSPLYF